jgi:hypothetical protein
VESLRDLEPLRLVEHNAAGEPDHVVQGVLLPFLRIVVRNDGNEPDDPEPEPEPVGVAA